MSVITKSISAFYARRLRTIESYGVQGSEMQHKQLQYLLKSASHTVWGEQFDYKSIHDYETFAARVPLQTYESLKPMINRMVKGEENVLWPSVVQWYAKSSGTTADRSKFIPISPEILEQNHFQGGKDALGIYLQNNPRSRFFEGKGLILGGSHKAAPLNEKSHCGDLSAVLLQNSPSWIELIRVPEKRIILMDEWESKIKAIVSRTWNKNVSNLSGIPSWMLVLIRAVLEKSGKESLVDVWPHLEVFFHGGVSFEPYRMQYEKLIPSDTMNYMEIYNASEGFFGLQDDPTSNSLLLMLDYGVFYEFIPMKKTDSTSEPAPVPLEGVKVGENYALVISTSGGLWRYQIGDTIRFTSLFPHKFKISGRTKHYINAFGEEVMVHNAEQGIDIACRKTNAAVRFFTAAPLFLLDKAKGRHQWIIEFEKRPTSLAAFALALDHAIQELNSDYEAKRYKEITLEPLEVIVARNGLFHDWLKMKGKLGGQHKIPRLSNDRILLEELLLLNK